MAHVIHNKHPFFSHTLKLSSKYIYKYVTLEEPSYTFRDSSLIMPTNFSVIKVKTIHNIKRNTKEEQNVIFFLVIALSSNVSPFISGCCNVCLEYDLREKYTMWLKFIGTIFGS